MIGLLQRVTESSVTVDGETIGKIGKGLMVLIGIERNDNEHSAKRLLERILSYRVFPDKAGKMNLSLIDIEGGLLLIPQFTLAADTSQGTRPGFSRAATPQVAKQLYADFVMFANKDYSNVAHGKFGADMQVHLINDGPVTFWLRVEPKQNR